MIRERGWIRARKDGFWLWRLDARTLRLLRTAEDYWRQQRHLTSADAFDVNELSSGGRFWLTLEQFKSARSLKALTCIAGNQAYGECAIH